jgi:8-oxo-dGTP pyrophosphatase MutT (NUDIX family)
LPKAIKEKVVAYITQGNKFLVFSHPFHPEAGIQVPAGSIKTGESPAEAVLREAQEETGLDGLELRAFLGVQEYDFSPYGRAEIQRRYFFHLEFRGKTPTTWRHFENDPSEGGTEPIEFELFWVQFPDEVPDLIAGQGALMASILNKQL